MNFISDDEGQELIMNLAKSRGERGFTEDDAHAVLQWAHEIKASAILLQTALNGRVAVDVRDGEVIVQTAASAGHIGHGS